MLRSALVAIAIAAPAAIAQPLTTAFTYQGHLNSAGSPAAGAHDFQFALYDAASGGAQIGATLCADNVTVANGVFTVSLDFGNQYTGQRYLEVRARQDAGQDCSAPTGFTTLAPRQPITAAPAASFALSAPATGLTGTLPDARLSTNIPRLNADNQFSGTNLFSGFTGVNRASPFTGAEVFGLQNHPAQSGYVGMYINSTAPGGLPFYGYSVGGAVAWTYLDSAGIWRLYNGVSALTALNNGNVGIGLDNPSSRLHVAGAATADDFSFSAPKTSFLMIPASAFDAPNNAPVSRTVDDVSFPASTTNRLLAPVMLPHGATITAMHCYVVDNAPSRISFILFRADTNGFTTAQASVSTTGPAAGMQTISLSGLAIVVDNSTGAFTLSAIPHGGTWPGGQHRIRSVRLDYTLPRPAR